MTNKTRHARAFLAAGLIGLVMLAGCAGERTDQNQAPDAVLETNRDSAMVGEPFTFDAQSSSDPDGRVTKWHFDFGDGTTMQVEDEDAARVQHAYDRGGEYTVTVTVTDDGAEEEAAKSDEADARIAVNEEVAIATGPVHATPLPNQTASMQVPFTTYEGIDAYDLMLEIESVLLTGSSEVRIRILDAGGDVVYDENIVVDAGTTASLDVDGPYDSIGDGTFRVDAESGGAQVTGSLTLVYDEGF